MKSYHENKRCTVEKYHWWYEKLNVSSCGNLTSTHCYFIEKTPIYSRTPWIPIIYSNMMPKVKLITIIRNPLNHIWSNAFAFSSRDGHEISKTEYWIIDHFNKTYSFNKLTKMCYDINIKWHRLNESKISKNVRHAILMKTDYKLFVIEYLKLKFVSPRDINRETRQAMFEWAPFLLPNILIGLLSYEQELGIYEQFKLIQFEYIYSDTANAMSNVRCWMMGICGNDDKEKDYLFEKIEKTNHATKNNTFSEWYDNQIHTIFGPCNETLMNLLLIDRRDLLIGEWLDWT